MISCAVRGSLRLAVRARLNNRCTREHFRLRVPVTFNNYCLYVIRKRFLTELPKALSVSSSSVLFISFVLVTL